MFFFFVLLSSTLGWSPDSWRQFKFKQIPKYDCVEDLRAAEEDLRNSIPLVLADEAECLKKELTEVERGHKFLFMGGDCAETFQEHSTNNVIKNFQLFMIGSILLMQGTGMEVVKIARMAGQFSKPRSRETEVIDGITVPAYKGDMINRQDASKRNPDPALMLNAYHQSLQTMNLIRGLKKSSFSTIDVRNWATDLDIYKLDILKQTVDDLGDTLNFLQACGINNNVQLKNAELYTGHEGLLLNYEEAMTRKDRFTNNYYDCSAHFLWIGERTRKLDEAHVEFFRGIKNPIGIKISEKITNLELIKLIEILNPENESGRISLITRMGPELSNHLPRLIDIIQFYKKKVTWVCDPMHGNGITMDGTKTRDIKDILAEVETFFRIHHSKNTIPGGIHLEMTSRDVTECLGGMYINDDYPDYLTKNYETSCDPRLNLFQTVEVLEKLIDNINQPRSAAVPNSCQSK